MNRFALAAAALLLCGQAHAQPPQEITASDSIELGVGQGRTFEFDQKVGKISLNTEGIAKVTPESDRTFNIQAERPGSVMMTAYTPDGRVIHRVNIRVAGTIVKVYGLTDSRSTSPANTFTSYYCTSTGCGRANPDIQRGPNKTTISDTTNKANGEGAVTIEREYR